MSMHFSGKLVSRLKEQAPGGRCGAMSASVGPRAPGPAGREAARVAANDVVAADPELVSHPGLAGMISDPIHEELLEKT
ncbi:hypothetical protein GCM10022247_61070 [Allokutzneria multivorans]|uniref:Uncharacterized protein n=1 Tax=Allokutzneria multivorans TaxID=1142134 RepID=A0ABP7TMW7_9PSEU